MSQIYKSVSSAPSVATTFQTDSGSAVPAANIIIFHAVGGTFSGSGNEVTYTAASTGIPWTDEATSFLAVSNNGYFCTAALTMTMPASPLQGDIIFVISDYSGVITLQANAGQKFRVGGSTSIVGGTCTSSALGDAVEFVYRSTDSTWYCANSPQGTFTTN